MMASLHIFHAVLSAVSAIMIFYVLVSKKTFGLAYKRFTIEISIVFLLFSIIGFIEFLGFKTIEQVLNVFFSVLLFYVLLKKFIMDYPKKKKIRF